MSECFDGTTVVLFCFAAWVAGIATAVLIREFTP